MPAAETLPDGRIRLPGEMAVDDAATLLETTWETDAATVGGLVTEALGHLPAARRDGRRSATSSSKSNGVRRRVAAVGRRQTRRACPDRRTSSDGGPRSRSRSSSCSSWPTGCSSPRSSRSSARREPASSTRLRRAAGWPDASLQHPRRSEACRIAISRRRRSASRSRASGWACMASTGLPNRIAAVARCRFETLGLDCRAHRRQRHRRRHADLPAHRARRDGARRRWRCSARDKTVLYVSPVIEALERAMLPLVVALNAVGNALLRLVGIERQRGRAGALSHRRGAAVHHPGEPGRRPAARRVGADSARPVRVRRPDSR